MRFIKHLLFTLLLVAGLSAAAMAQKGNPPQKPPKNPPEVIPGKGNPKPRETPKPSKPHRPGDFEAIIGREDTLVDFA